MADGFPEIPQCILSGARRHRFDHGHRRMLGRNRPRQAQISLLEQAGIFLDRSLAAAAEHHHLQIEPSAGARAVVGRERRFQHQHMRVRLHGAAHIGENAHAIAIVVIVHEVADQIEVAAFRRRRREHVAGDETHARQRAALAALGGRDGLRHVEQGRAAVRIGGEHRGQQRPVAAADVDDVFERREIVAVCPPSAIRGDACTQRRTLGQRPSKTTFSAYQIKFHEIIRAEAMRKIGQIQAGCVLTPINVHDKFEEMCELLHTQERISNPATRLQRSPITHVLGHLS